jgi:hypothetical protein
MSTDESISLVGAGSDVVVATAVVVLLAGVERGEGDGTVVTSSVG